MSKSMLEWLPENAVIIDTETVTLDPAAGSVWEIAVYLTGNTFSDGSPSIASTLVRPDLSIADPVSLEVGRFAERYNADFAADPAAACDWLADRLPADAILVGSNPWFDMAHLEALPWAATAVGRPPWGHHPLDVPSMVAAVTGHDHTIEVDRHGPRKSLSLAWAHHLVCGGPKVAAHPPDHTAAGDVRATIDILAGLDAGSVACL